VIVLCPNCGGRVRVEEVDVVVEGGYRVAVYKGRCEKCGRRVRLRVRTLLPGPDYRCGYLGR
jgi:DNA-directed RNA polymerase subunit RPC12/RpoP